MNEETTVSSSEGTQDPVDDSPVVVVLDEDQYQVLVDHIKKYDDDMQDIKDDVLSVKGSIDKLNNATANSKSEATVVTPDDFYSYISDTQGQSVFFLSLLCGFFLAFAFFFGLKDKLT